MNELLKEMEIEGESEEEKHGEGEAKRARLLLQELFGDVDMRRASKLECWRVFQEFCHHSVQRKRRAQGEKVNWLQKHIRERVHRRAKASNQMSALRRHVLPP